MSELVGPGSKYTDEDRRRVVGEYCVTGNLQAVSKSTGIPRTTLIGWMNADWWVSLHDEVRQQTSAKILASTEQVIEKSYTVVIDRLDNGDPKLLKDPDGVYKEHRVGMSGKEAALVGAINVDKRQLLLNQPTSISSSSGSKRIEDLVKKFQDLADQHNARTIEGEYTSKGLEVADGIEDAS